MEVKKRLASFLCVRLLTPCRALCYNAGMARTASLENKSADRIGRGRAKKRELPLGAAIAYGLGAALAAGIVIALTLVLVPGTAAHQFFSLVSGIHSATLPLDPLYQEWSEKISEEETLFATPASMLCGGLTLGWLAPSYASRRSVLLSGGLMGFGVIATSIAFVWIAGVANQNALNHQQGGQQVIITAPPELIVKQAVAAVLWTAICVLGTWLGQRLRARQQAPH